jgi:hypothetical protein
VAGINGESREGYAIGNMDREVDEAVPPVQPLQQCAHAILDLLQRALRDPWDQPVEEAWPPGISRLHPASSRQCSEAVQPCSVGRPWQHAGGDR